MSQGARSAPSPPRDSCCESTAARALQTRNANSSMQTRCPHASQIPVRKKDEAKTSPASSQPLECEIELYKCVYAGSHVYCTLLAAHTSSSPSIWLWSFCFASHVFSVARKDLVTHTRVWALRSASVQHALHHYILLATPPPPPLSFHASRIP